MMEFEIEVSSHNVFSEHHLMFHLGDVLGTLHLCGLTVWFSWFSGMIPTSQTEIHLKALAFSRSTIPLGKLFQNLITWLKISRLCLLGARLYPFVQMPILSLNLISSDIYSPHSVLIFLLIISFI